MTATLIHLCNELSRIDNIPKDKKYENIKAYSKHIIDSIIQILNILYPKLLVKAFMKEFLISSNTKYTNTKQKLNINEFLHYLYKYNYIESGSSISPSITTDPDLTTHFNYYYILEHYLCISMELEDTSTKIEGNFIMNEYEGNFIMNEYEGNFIMNEYEYIFMLNTKIRFIILLFLHFKLIKSTEKNYIPDLNIVTTQLLIDMM